MDDLRFYILFNSIYVISVPWLVDNEKKNVFAVGKISA